MDHQIYFEEWQISYYEFYSKENKSIKSDILKYDWKIYATFLFHFVKLNKKLMHNIQNLKKKSMSEALTINIALLHFHPNFKTH